MIDKSKIKAIAFDFGGTLDSPFMHWADVYLEVYTRKLGLPLNRDNFWDSYVYAEQQMERRQLVQPTDSLFQTQSYKTKLQFESLVEKGVLPDTPESRETLPVEAARLVTDYSSAYVHAAQKVLAVLHESYTLLLVSNYYGNIKQIATDLGISSYFVSITDSTVEGVRKPDPLLWKLAIERAGFKPEETLVVGDSMKNDTLPALSLGCQVVLGCPPTKERPADITSIGRIDELLNIL